MQNKISWIGPIALAVAFAGCATTPQDRKVAASDSMHELHDSMVATRGQIERTLVSLDALMTASPEGLRPAFRQYAEDTDRVEEMADTVQEESSQLRLRSNEWLQGWQESQADVQDPELRSISESRRAEALERIQSIDRSLTQAREAFTPFVRNLQDVKRVVGNDLTPNGVAAVSDTAVAQNANQSGTQVARALDVAIEDLQVLTQRLTTRPTSNR